MTDIAGHTEQRDAASPPDDGRAESEAVLAELTRLVGESRAFVNDATATFKAEGELNVALAKETLKTGLAELMGYLIVWVLALVIIGYSVWAFTDTVALALGVVAAAHTSLTLAIRSRRRALKRSIGFERTSRTLAQLSR